MKIHAPKELARAIAALLDLLADNEPAIAAECIEMADRMRLYAGPIASAGPEDPPLPPAHG